MLEPVSSTTTVEEPAVVSSAMAMEEVVFCGVMVAPAPEVMTLSAVVEPTARCPALVRSCQACRARIGPLVGKP
jgi:hypothetical protein